MATLADKFGSLASTIRVSVICAAPVLAPSAPLRVGAAAASCAGLLIITDTCAAASAVGVTKKRSPAAAGASKVSDTPSIRKGSAAVPLPLQAEICWPLAALRNDQADPSNCTSRFRPSKAEMSSIVAESWALLALPVAAIADGLNVLKISAPRLPSRSSP